MIDHEASMRNYPLYANRLNNAENTKEQLSEQCYRLANPIGKHK
jgi:hypothetical protein